jgi:hypothetical protein
VFLLPIGLVAWNIYITREILFVFYSSSGRSPEKMRPLVKILSVASSYLVGRLEQLGHSRNPFHVLFFIGQVT